MNDTVTPLSPSRIATLMQRTVVACIVLASISVTYAQTPATVVGSLPGQFSVSETGAATYRIPLEVPPGIAGVEPKIALTYSSQNSNGLLGTGWSLEGLSTITRCPRTLAQDGVRGTVSYNASDRYCLDGKRLFASGGGVEGANATEYRTELDSFSKIQSWYDGSSSPWSGPTSWTVKTKAGLTLEYGKTADARIELQGKTAVTVWALNRISDAKGNYLTLTYTENNANGEYYPARIDYTGNATANQAPTHSIQFTYESRPDAVPAYRAGSLMKSTVRLAAIHTYAANTLITRTALTYESTGPVQTSRIAAITRCTGQNQCFAPTRFTYGVDVTGFASAVTAFALPSYSSDDAPYMSKSNQTGTTIDLVDLNGDGLPDLYNAGLYKAWLNTGSGFAATSLSWPLPNGDTYLRKSDSTGTTVALVDMNGDGLPDLYNAGFSKVWLNTGSSFATTPIAWSLPNGDMYMRRSDGVITTVDLVDLNGDGLPDLYNAALYKVWLNTGSGFAVTPTDWPLPNNDNYIRKSDAAGTIADLIDMNGDGLPDFYHANLGKVWLNTGTGFATAPITWALPAAANSGVYLRMFNETGTTLDLVDMNGDGLPDLYYPGLGKVWFNTGNGFATTEVVWSVPAAVNATEYLSKSDGTGVYVSLGDFNGDGMPDVFNSKYSVLGTSQGKAAGLIVEINNGLDAPLTINYKTLAHPATYLKDTDAVFPKVDLCLSLYVVSAVNMPNGLGGTIVTEYSYGGLKAEVGTGRGLLGFRWMKSKNMATSIEDYSEFRQDWPYTGMVAKTEARLANAGNAGVLKRITTTYSQTTGSAAPAIFVYPGISMEQSWDLNGAPFPGTTTTYQYDLAPQYGDPTQITVTKSDGSSKTTVNQYWPANTANGNWILGRLKQATVTNTKP